MRPARAIVFGLIALIVAVVVGLACGEPFGWSRAISDASSIDRAILGVRWPRVALGVVAGAGLASTGAAYQALLRNPLAEPYVLGVAGGAALGATIALSLGAGALVSSIGVGVTALAATIGGALATAAAWLVASRRSTKKQGGFAHGDATSILLAGVVVNAIAAAAITFLKTLVRSEVAQSLLYWLAGFVDVPSTGALVAVASAVAIGGAMLVADAARLNLLALGDEQASHLGVDVRALERRVFAASSLVVGAIVATCGMIGFVGLLVPHVLRRSMLRGGSDYRVLVPASLFVGGAVLVLCDGAARMVYRGFGTEPPVGAITALVGGPVFLMLLSRRAR
jgi:iron complex transport system permease protein